MIQLSAFLVLVCIHIHTNSHTHTHTCMYTHTHSQLFTAIENCQKQFGSKDVGTAVSDTQRLLVTLEELRNSVEQAAEEVQDQGKKLLEIMASIGLSSKANGLEAPDKQEAGSDQVTPGLTQQCFSSLPCVLLYFEIPSIPPMYDFPPFLPWPIMCLYLNFPPFLTWPIMCLYLNFPPFLTWPIMCLYLNFSPDLPGQSCAYI